MTAEQFRRMALSLPDVSESAHMNHPDFRVNGKIFATLGYPDPDHGVIILPPEEQKHFLEAEPDCFAPAAGAWGARGATAIRLDAARVATVRRALAIAWKKRAPKKLVRPVKRTSD